MSPRRDDLPMLDIARGDEVVNRRLHAMLRTMRDRSADPAFHALADGVSAGRTSLRAAYREVAFQEAVGPAVQQLVRRPLTPEQRAELSGGAPGG